MGSKFKRGDKWYLSIKGANGRWQQFATGTSDEREADKILADVEARAGAERDLGSSGPMTVRSYAKGWIVRRREADLDWKNDDGRLQHHVLPRIGDMRIADVRARHLVELFHKIRTTPSETTGEPVAQRTVYNIYSVVTAMFRDAKLDGVIDQTPCELTNRQLGPLVDSDPMWRASAVFTREEAETLISDARIPLDRRAYYALGLLAGMRPGEIAALRVLHYDATTTPLGKLTVAFAHNTRKNRTKNTKTDAVRSVPVHPTLSAILGEWLTSGWAAMMGRQPEPGDLFLPLPPAAASRRRTRSGEAIRTGDYMGKRWREADLVMLGWRDRELYATKSTFITLAIEDGARSDVIRDRVTTRSPSATRSPATTADRTGSRPAGRSRS